MSRGVLLSALLLAQISARPALADELTLDDVVHAALTRNERARMAELDVESSEAAVTKALAGLLPTISLAANGTLHPYQLTDAGSPTLPNRAVNATVSVSQPVFDFTVMPRYLSATKSLEAARHGQAEERRQLCFDAARAFFSVIAQQRLLTAAQARLASADATLADTHARVQAKLVSINDETRAQVERAAAQQTVAYAGAALEEARNNLEDLVNLPIPTDLHAPDTLPTPVPSSAQLASQALAQRPDVASAHDTAEAAALSAEEPSLRLVPTIDAQAQLKLSDQLIAEKQHWDTTLALTMSWQIWDGGLRQADEQSRWAAAGTAELKAQALRRRVLADVRSAVAGLTAARAAVVAAQAGLTAARKSANETAELYRRGLAKAIELFNANQSRFDAEVSLAGAQLALQQSELDLRAARGLFPIDGVK